MAKSNLKKEQNLSYDHYVEWCKGNFSNLERQRGSFATVRGLLRDVYKEDKKAGLLLIDILKKDFKEFINSL